jgi:hypothetical protein
MLSSIARLLSSHKKAQIALTDFNHVNFFNRFVPFVLFVATSSLCGASYRRPRAFRIQSKESVIN